MRASRQIHQPSEAKERGEEGGISTWMEEPGEGSLGGPTFSLSSCPLLSHLPQVTSRSLSTPPCGGLWSWWALLPAQCSSSFSSSSLFSSSLTIISVSITTARGWTWRTPRVRCVSPRTRRSRTWSMTSPRQGLAQVPPLQASYRPLAFLAASQHDGTFRKKAGHVLSESPFFGSLDT